MELSQTHSDPGVFLGIRVFSGTPGTPREHNHVYCVSWGKYASGLV